MIQASAKMLLLPVLALACMLLLGTGPMPANAGFVTKSGHQLMLNGSPFYFLGGDAYWLQNTADSNVDIFFADCNARGLKVVRFWAFNYNLPEAAGVYDETEFKHLDYIVNSAGSHSIKLILALGNTWNAYRSPEDFMRMAGVNPDGKDLLDFYSSPEVATFYKGHMKSMVTRVNTYNGKAYKDDDAIMMWDVFNEPRCPGCMDAASQSTHQNWLSSMSSYLKGLVPSQLVAAGTEGFFFDSANIRSNPGAGSMCEGEDWMAINRLGSIDVCIAHIYDRQVESIPPSWQKCNWTCYFSFFSQYIDKHIQAASDIGKPFVVEEFNVLSGNFTDQQRTAFFQLVYDKLLGAKKSGSPLMGVMFWNAAIGQVPDDGYNIYIDVGPPSATTLLPAPAPAPAGGGSAPPSVSTVQPGPPSARGPTYVNTEGLDAFRRGAQREACAEQQAKTWLPDWSMDAVDTSSYLSRTQGKSVQQVIQDTASQL